MANPGKPAEIKRVLGSRHYTPSASFVEAVSSIPEPLRRLDDSGFDLWRRAWSMAHGWLSLNSDVDLLLMTCEMLDERDSLREYVFENPDAWRDRAAVRELEKSIRSNLSLLGFTPTDRMKLGVQEIKAKTAMEQFQEMKKPDDY